MGLKVQQGAEFFDALGEVSDSDRAAVGRTAGVPAIHELPRAFLTSEAAIEKQLTRTKQRIQNAHIGFDISEGKDLAARLDGVLAALYLLFNEGYKASAGERLLREGTMPGGNPTGIAPGQPPRGQHAAQPRAAGPDAADRRAFSGRLDERGGLLRLDDHDCSKWDQSLIARGLVELAAAAQGHELSEYHLQAGIAAIHCMAADYASTDWARILRHYDELNRIKPSPVVALNRAVVVAHLHGP